MTTFALQIEQLRNSARYSRNMSKSIGACRALSLYGLAGTETWVGPTAQSCFDALVRLRRELQGEEQSLADKARAYDRRADELERQLPMLRHVS